MGAPKFNKPWSRGGLGVIYFVRHIRGGGGGGGGGKNSSINPLFNTMSQLLGAATSWTIPHHK